MKSCLVKHTSESYLRYLWKPRAQQSGIAAARPQFVPPIAFGGSVPKWTESLTDIAHHAIRGNDGDSLDVDAARAQIGRARKRETKTCLELLLQF